MNSSLNSVISKLNNARCVAIFCHSRPDGDALGSGLALCLALKNAGKTAVMCCEDAPPQKFEFLPQIAEVKTELPDLNYDLMVSVDCADAARMGAFAKRFAKFVNTLNIDHHISNSCFAKYNYVIDCPASCEIMCDVLRAGKFDITEDIANLLMLGLVTDSGLFTHCDVTPKTFETAAYLRGNCADVNKINYNMFARQPKNRALLYGRVMSRIRFYHGDKLAVIVITAADMRETNCDKSITEGFVDFPLTVDGVEVSVALMEFKENQYKASLRSKGAVNVNAIATAFGGGGHVLASGCMIMGSLEHVIDKLSYAVYQNL